MPSNAHPVWVARLCTFALAAALAGSAVYWTLKIRTPTVAAVAVLALDSGPLQPDTQSVAKALGAVTRADDDPGAQLATASAASRFVLTGVVAQGRHRGAALIAVDGQAPKPFAVGAPVADGWVLRSVQPRRAALARATAADAETADEAALVLELPPLPSLLQMQSKNSL